MAPVSPSTGAGSQLQGSSVSYPLGVLQPALAAAGLPSCRPLSFPQQRTSPPRSSAQEKLNPTLSPTTLPHPRGEPQGDGARRCRIRRAIDGFCLAGVDRHRCRTRATLRTELTKRKEKGTPRERERPCEKQAKPQHEVLPHTILVRAIPIETVRTCGLSRRASARRAGGPRIRGDLSPRRSRRPERYKGRVSWMLGTCIFVRNAGAAVLPMCMRATALRVAARGVAARAKRLPQRAAMGRGATLSVFRIMFRTRQCRAA